MRVWFEQYFDRLDLLLHRVLYPIEFGFVSHVLLDYCPTNDLHPIRRYPRNSINRLNTEKFTANKCFPYSPFFEESFAHIFIFFAMICIVFSRDLITRYTKKNCKLPHNQCLTLISSWKNRLVCGDIVDKGAISLIWL